MPDYNANADLPFFNTTYISKNNIVKESYEALRKNKIRLNGDWSSYMTVDYQYDSLGYPKKSVRYRFEYIDLK
jgi:hypothetical protein